MSSILLVDDDLAFLRAMSRVLEREGFSPTAVTDGDEALSTVANEEHDLVLTDLEMPGDGGLALVRKLASRGGPPTIVVSGTSNLESAAEAIKEGALDFLQKPVPPERLIVTVRNALRFLALDRRRGLKAILGEAPPVRELRALIAKIAPTDGRVLILGENGTGKELVASALHDGSRRRGKPFVTINCAAIPSELVESELFGHEKGAFTGASRTRRGRFEEASGGTLFLDEIGDMPLPMQAKLLRVLQEGQIQRVGSSGSIDVDVRVIAATHRDPLQMISEGTFREDLYYRMAVVTLRVPPLRERLCDVPVLARAFLDQSARRMGRRPLELSDEARDALMAHDYPGNVRELINTMERLTILTEGSRIEAADVKSGRTPGKRSKAGLYRQGRTFRELINDAERTIIREALEAHDGNRTDAARALRIDRSNFYKKCRALGLLD